MNNPCCQEEEGKKEKNDIAIKDVRNLLRLFNLFEAIKEKTEQLEKSANFMSKKETITNQ